MNDEAAARLILDGVKEAGINLIASLPDINLAQLLRLIEQEKDVIHVPLCREEEGIGICAGAYLVGKKCAAIMQNGGFSTATTRSSARCFNIKFPFAADLFCVSYRLIHCPAAAARII